MTTVLNRPKVVLEGAFNTVSDTGDRIWNDITSFVDFQDEGLSVAQRRSTVFDERSPGTLTFSVVNDDGEFTDTNDGSPFYPGITNNTPLRARIQYPTTVNLLPGAVSRADDVNFWQAEQGQLDTLSNSDSWSFETDVSGASGYGDGSGAVSVAQYSDWSSDGDYSAIATVTTSPSTNWGISIGTSSGVVVGGDVITFSCDFYNPGPDITDNIVLDVDYYDASDSYISSTTATASSLNSLNSVTLTIADSIVPATASYFHIFPHIHNAGSIGDQFAIDNVYYTVNSALAWSTGVLEQTDVRVMVDTGVLAEPGDQPIYVEAGEVYSASINLRADDTIDCSLNLAWYAQDGTFVSEESSSTVSLTTDYQTLTITDVTAPVDGSLRLSISNETTVLPSSRAIDYSGGTDITKQWVKEVTFEIPDSASAGDFAMAWIRLSNKNAQINIPNGWTEQNSWADSRGRTTFIYKIVAPHDPGSKVKVTLSPGNTHYSRWYISCITYTQVDQSSPIHKHNESTEATVTTSHATPSVTTTTANCWIVSAVFDVSSTNNSWGAPGGETVRQYGYCVKGNACTGIITDDATAHATGTYGTKTFTASKKSKYATKHTIALTPATGTGPDNVNVYATQVMVVNASSLPSFVEAGDWTTLITAYADEWAPYWQLDHAMVNVSATDRSKLLDPITVGSAVSEAIEDLDPVGYYRLNETGSGAEDDTTTGADSTAYSQPPLTPTKAGTGAGVSGDSALQWGQGKSAGVDGDASLIINAASNANGYYLVAEHLNTPLGGGEGVSVVMFWKSSASGSNELTMLKFSPVTKAGSTRTQLEFYGKPGNYVGVKASLSSDGTTYSVDARDSTDYFDSTTRMLGATLELVGGQVVLSLYVDGVVTATDSATTSVTDVKTMNALAVGNAYPNFSRMCLGTYSNIAFYNYVIGDDDMQNISDAGLTSFAGEAVTDRMYRILDWEDTTGTDFDSSDILVDRHMPDDMSLLDSLRLVAATDGGTVYINGDDQIAFRASSTKESEFDPVLTLSAGDLAVQPSATQNDVLLVNDVTVNRLGAGNSQRLTNDASVVQYGRHDKSIDTLCYTDQDAAAICGYYIAFYAQPLTRFDTIAAEMLLQSDWTDFFAATQMWKIIRVTDLPNTAPSDILDSHVEGIQWDITADSWLLTWDVSYAIPFAIVDDETRGIMGNVVVAR